MLLFGLFCRFILYYCQVHLDYSKQVPQKMFGEKIFEEKCLWRVIRTKNENSWETLDINKIAEHF